KALRAMAEHEGHRCAQRRDLRQREVDEDDVAREHLNPEIGVDADEAHRHQEGRPDKSDRFDHLDPAALTSAATSVSNKARKSPVPGSAPTEVATTPTDAPVLPATKATSRSGSCGSRTTRRTLRACIFSMMPARCDGVDGTPGLISRKSMKSSRNLRAKYGQLL